MCSYCIRGGSHELPFWTTNPSHCLNFVALPIVRMRGIPVMEKYRYILYFKRYDIIILLNSLFHMLQIQNAPVGCNASQIAAQSVHVTTEQRDDQIDETLSTHPKLIYREE